MLLVLHKDKQISPFMYVEDKVKFYTVKYDIILCPVVLRGIDAMKFVILSKLNIILVI